MKIQFYLFLVINITCKYLSGQVGLSEIAKIYPNEYQGSLTHSGEIYDFDKLTAAHPSLPFGTLLKVINKENNKRVIVRVNDRISLFLPWKLLLSKSAGENLNVNHSIPFKIQVDILKVGDNKELTSKGIVHQYPNALKYKRPINGEFAIQLGNFRNEKAALDLILDLEIKGFTQIHLRNKNEGNTKLYNVLVGPFNDYNHAEATNKRLRFIFNLEGFVITVN